jgi:L-fuconolactonase
MRKRTLLKAMGLSLFFPATAMASRGESPPEFRGNAPKSTRELADWLARAPAAAAIEPAMPIVDPHHHLFGSLEDRVYYRLEDLKRDLDSGHRIIGTVHAEAYDSGWRKTGPEALRPVGETEMIVGLTRQPLSTASGECQVAAGIICHANLLLGDQVEDVLREHEAVAQGRLRGLRHRTATVEGAIGRLNPMEPRLLSHPQFRRGVSRLARFGLSLDTYSFHTQIGELIELADAFPGTTIVANHVVVPLGVAEFRSRRAEVLREWRAGMRALAVRPNVLVKVGGMGMPIFGFGFEHRNRPATAAELALAWSPYIETCVEAFGTSRCMFESNFPVDKQSSTYCELWNAFKLATERWSHRERTDLFYRTACKAYRLPALERLGDQLAGDRKA